MQSTAVWYVFLLVGYVPLGGTCLLGTRTSVHLAVVLLVAATVQ